ncbi:hypothetical protein P7C70_g5117, partial [Phenoliferia sp. Uapishka_3]
MPGTPDRAAFGSLTRQHSRSSSQIATLASLSLSPACAPHRLPPSSSSSSVGSSRDVSPTRLSFAQPRNGMMGGLGLELEREAQMEAAQEQMIMRSRAGSVDDATSKRGRSSISRATTTSSPRQLSPILQSSPSVNSYLSSSLSSLPPPPPASSKEDDDEQSPIAQLIQQRRRQASAPYFTSARSSTLFSPGAGFGILGSPAPEDDGRRSRMASRRGSFSKSGGLGLMVDIEDSNVDWEQQRGMVMTPTTEEWRQLGGQLSELADVRARDEARLAEGVSTMPGSASSGHSSNVSSSSSSSSLSLSLLASTHPTSSASLASPVDILPAKTSFSYQTSRTGFQSHGGNNSLSVSSLHSNKSLSSSPESSRGVPAPNTAPIPTSSTFKPSHRPHISSDGQIRPNLSRGSLSSTTGTPNAGTPATTRTTPFFDNIGEGQVSQPDTENGRPSSPVKVDLDPVNCLGPVDPSKYSAVTGLRTINDFVVMGEAGKGAYGTVRKAREKGPDGLPTGPSLIIKYVIKQRILADCWKKHKILGPIPIEVHVLDHLRRVPFLPRPPGRRRKLGTRERRDSAPSIKEGTITGHPNICGMLDFFEDGEFYYLVMPVAGSDPNLPDLPGGQDLFEFVDLHPDGLAPPSIRHILSQIADALYFLHEHGIVHRDIKDENIVLDHYGNVQLIDFGSAAYVKDGKKFDTFSGTLDFAAPEVLKGQRYGGRETDIWALGVLGYVLICGEVPFWQQAHAIAGIAPESRAYDALQAKIPTLSESAAPLLPSDFNRPLDEFLDAASMAEAVDLVMRCLEVEPANRPSANDVLDHSFFLGSEGWSGFRGFEGGWKEGVEADGGE